MRQSFGICMILVALCSPGLAVQDKAKSKKPVTSKSVDFDPTKLGKLAVLITGGERDGQTQQLQQRLVEDGFLESLLAKGYTLVARSDVDAVLKEKKFQESDLSEEAAASIGKVLNVPAMLVVRITECNVETPRSETYIAKTTIGARLISVENGTILWTGKHSESSPMLARSALGTVLQNNATELAEAFPERESGFDKLTANKIDSKILPKVAVISIGERSNSSRSGKGGKADSQSDRQRQVEDAIIQVLMQKGYRLVSRSDIQAVVKEQQFQRSGVTEDNAVALGKLLNVPAVMLVMVTDFTNESRHDSATDAQMNFCRASVGARLINVGNGEIWWAHTESLTKNVSSRTATTDVLDKAAKEVAEFFPPAPESKKTLLSQAERLEKFGQITAAMNYYRCIKKSFPDSAEGGKATARLNLLSKKRQTSVGAE